MRKILTMFTALLMAVGLMAPAYAANTEYTYTETSEYVYLAEDATLYYNPGKSSAVYGAVSAALASEQVEIVQICNETGQLCFKHSGVYVWIAPDNVSENASEAAIDATSADAEEGTILMEKLAEVNWLFVLYLLTGIFWTIMEISCKTRLSYILLGWIGITGFWYLNDFIEACANGNRIAWLVFAAALLIPPIVKFVKWLSADS